MLTTFSISWSSFSFAHSASNLHSLSVQILRQERYASRIYPMPTPRCRSLRAQRRVQHKLPMGCRIQVSGAAHEPAHVTIETCLSVFQTTSYRTSLLLYDYTNEGSATDPAARCAVCETIVFFMVFFIVASSLNVKRLSSLSPQRFNLEEWLPIRKELPTDAAKCASPPRREERKALPTCVM